MSEPLPSSSDRRFANRFPCDLEIKIEWGAASLRGRVRDISDAGMFVEVESPLWIGARFTAELSDPAAQLECVVRRVQPRRGMALSYAASDKSRAALELLLNGFVTQ